MGLIEMFLGNNKIANQPSHGQGTQLLSAVSRAGAGQTENSAAQVHADCLPAGARVELLPYR